MTLFGKRATAGAAPVYDVRPVKPAMFRAATLWAPVSFVKNAAQGACAGLLTFLGAMHMTAGFEPDGEALAAMMSLDAASLNAVVENLMDGGIPGMVEIVGAAVLFLNAGRGWAKVLGLMAFIAIAFAHANGVEHGELLQKMTDLYEGLQTTLVKFQVVQQSV